MTAGIQAIEQGFKECQAGDCKMDAGLGDMLGGVYFTHNGIVNIKRYIPECKGAFNPELESEYLKVMETAKSLFKNKDAKVEIDELALA